MTWEEERSRDSTPQQRQLAKGGERKPSGNSGGRGRLPKGDYQVPPSGKPEGRGQR